MKLFNFSSSKVYDKTYKTHYLFLVFIRTKYKICSVFCSVLRRSYRLCLYMIYKQSYKKSSRKIKCLIKFCFNYCRIAYYANILLEIHNLNVLVAVEFGGGGGVISKHVYCGNNSKMVKQYFLLSYLFLEFI